MLLYCIVSILLPLLLPLLLRCSLRELFTAPLYNNNNNSITGHLSIVQSNPFPATRFFLAPLSLTVSSLLENCCPFLTYLTFKLTLLRSCDIYIKVELVVTAVCLICTLGEVVEVLFICTQSTKYLKNRHRNWEQKYQIRQINSVLVL